MPLVPSVKSIFDIADSVGLRRDELEPFGEYKAKVRIEAYEQRKASLRGKLICVSAMTPTKAGEGKTCTAIGLTQALGRLKKSVILCLREPSLAPIFGVKGGATGSGKAQLYPAEEINLHFTWDIHAITSAHNLLAALIDNHLHWGNELGLDPDRITWRRVLDISDRTLRAIATPIEDANGQTIQRSSGFDITAASEIMAVVGLSETYPELKARLGRMLIGYTREGRPVFVSDLQATGALALLVKDVLKPNLVQTIEGQPAFVHTGPFANVAHGNNSVIATKLALTLADYVVTECGFGSDLGFEKFCHIVCRDRGIHPDLVVLVASCRALKVHGGSSLETSGPAGCAAIERGFENLQAHLKIVARFGVPAVVAINRFPKDSEEELSLVKRLCQACKAPAAVSTVVAEGGVGGLTLAELCLEIIKQSPRQFRTLYDVRQPIREKIETIVTKVYGADGIDLSEDVETAIQRLTGHKMDGLPVNMSRTSLSFTDDATRVGVPKGWRLHIRQLTVCHGAGFLVAHTGKMLLMPGLPRHPASERIDIDDRGAPIFP